VTDTIPPIVSAVCLPVGAAFLSAGTSGHLSSVLSSVLSVVGVVLMIQAGPTVRRWDS
jgi:hypothetical protein